MRKILFVFLAVPVLYFLALHHGTSQAQTTPPVAAPVKTPGQGLSLEDRYIQCISSALCPLQTRLQIVQEETNEMNTHFQRLYEVCAARNFQDCADTQKADMDQWHSADYRAGQMMLSIEAQSLALKESAAGDSTKQAAVQKKSFWDRLWGK